ncbi:hypothetical protein AR457_35440 [Streptomyces agglomeratus]|nr:hypothetical protein AR457_36855 [Streptomyces agglomeratus]OEJ36157.1 hypothetical protein AR457_35440 [Streptomyces agglomeratus]OEJ36394.1 hypothetical protein BGK72_37320 [Streptomyces agglomeratus]OEJ56277.1 hypothetical protein BGM19_39185 [Streptomyces agglomeratus]OEJ56585.1 hypothetical protein BGM19_38740 [Streptomyces agglomeratus]
MLPEMPLWFGRPGRRAGPRLGCKRPAEFIAGTTTIAGLTEALLTRWRERRPPQGLFWLAYR